MNEPHPAESRQEWVTGVVTNVDPATWEVDVQLSFGSSGEIRRCKVVGPFLPEVHQTGPNGEKQPGRLSKVLVGFVDAYGQRPVAIPIHNVIIPDAEKAAHVYWSEHLNARITINRQNELEIRIRDGEKLYQLQMQQKDGVIRLKTPAMSIELNDAAGSIAAKCEGDATIVAGGNLEATAATAKVTATTITLQGNVVVTGTLAVGSNLAVTGNVAATGRIDDAGGNTNHHSHG